CRVDLSRLATTGTAPPAATPMATVTGPVMASVLTMLTDIQPLLAGGFGVTVSGVRTCRNPSATIKLLTAALPPAITIAVRRGPAAASFGASGVISFASAVMRSMLNPTTNASANRKETTGLTAREFNRSTNGRQLKRMARADSSTVASTNIRNNALNASGYV